MLLHLSVAVQALPPPATPLRPDGRLRRISDDAPDCPGQLRPGGLEVHHVDNLALDPAKLKREPVGGLQEALEASRLASQVAVAAHKRASERGRTSCVSRDALLYVADIVAAR